MAIQWLPQNLTEMQNASAEVVKSKNTVVVIQPGFSIQNQKINNHDQI